ncbi:MAG: DUF1467 family protein [Hyphomicrobiaceae bacterium]
MSTPFAVAIYFVVWWISLFLVLPFGVKTQDEDGEVVPGTPQSAPAKMRVWRMIIINTVVATAIFSVFYLAVTNGWISPDMFDYSNVPVVAQ